MNLKGEKFLNQKLEVVDSFKGDYEMFSNFYPCVVHYESFNFPTVEHAFVAAKSMDMMFRRRISEIPAEQPGKAKRLGRQCILRPDWELRKVSVMHNLLMQKFSYQKFRKLLLSTQDAMIIEGNYWHDNFWGDCYCEKCKDIPGKNQLGKLLMKTRRMIKL